MFTRTLVNCRISSFYIDGIKLTGGGNLTVNKIIFEFLSLSLGPIIFHSTSWPKNEKGKRKRKERKRERKTFGR